MSPGLGTNWWITLSSTVVSVLTASQGTWEEDLMGEGSSSHTNRIDLAVGGSIGV